MGGGLGQFREAIAAQLGFISYAAAEGCCWEVRRRAVLAMGQASVR